MALTPAEKQKRYRERLKQNQAKYEEAKRKHRQHYHRTKRLVKDLSPREKKNANTIWKLRQRGYRQRKKNLQTIIAETPPSSPIPMLQNVRDRENPTPSDSPSSNSTREQSNRKVMSIRSKTYREKKKMEQKMQLLKRKCEKLRKRLSRSKKKIRKDEYETTRLEKKYKLLTTSIREKYAQVKNKREKILLKSLLKDDEIVKCRNKNELFNEVLGTNRDYVSKTKISNNAIVLKNKIHSFFLRDDISRPTEGKRETVTRNGSKVQKRFLLDTMKSLHKQFKKENPTLECSYFYFTKNRPFFVVKPSADARETCLCKTHINFAYKTQVLKKQGILQTDNLCDIVNASVCDDQSKNCMYNDCKSCHNKTPKYNKDKIKGEIKYSQWIRKEEVYEKEGKKFKSIKNIKEELRDTIDNFLKGYEQDLVQFKKHVYNIKVQFHNFRLCLNNLQPDECAIVVDFSENYNCKYHEEVQSHHFGGSRKQVSLHPVMVYTHDPDKRYKPQSFCTISSSTCHQPAAIWAHLDPIMQFIRNEYRSVNTVHFFSDGPSTQYRQKQNFYLLCKKIFEYGFAASTWSFFEAGHGKGPADGIGGYLKRKADRLVATGKDIANVNDFMKYLNNVSKIKLYLIEEDIISDIQDNLPKQIPRLVGTMKVHHIFTDNENFLKYRSLTCFCGSLVRGFCDCYSPQIYKISTTNPITPEENIERNLTSDDEMPLSSLKVLKESRIKNQMFILQIGHKGTLYMSDSTSASEMTAEEKKRRKKLSNTEDEESQNPHLNKENRLISKNYSSAGGEDDDQPSTSSKGFSSRQVSVGDFLHVYVYSDALKKKQYSYVCKALTPIEEDGEVKVMFLRVAGKKTAKLFRLDERDINYVDYEDVIKILPMPTVVKKGLRIYYQFNVDIDVFEK